MWIYNNTEVSEQPPGYKGFVYLIVNKLNGKQYIGKKIFTRKVRLKRKTTRNKIVYKDSDWAEYYGSSPRLLADIEHYGKNNFERQILHLCKTKSEMTYLEAKEQFLRGVLESDMFYNDWIYARVRRTHLKAKTAASAKQ